ncbi:m7GpppX diphosphatase [Parasteatoda tepidariorum]|nr:m7GpppX diphosphatase [Parasteatoda tepidariorum]
MSDVDSSDDVSRKRIKLSTEEELQSPDAVAEDLSAHTRINSFSDFKMREVLFDNKESKSIFVEGSFDPVSDKAVLLLEKSSFEKENVERFLKSADLALNLKPSVASEPNEVNYACYPNVERGDIIATVICPATNKHIEKYTEQHMFVVHETPDAYKTVVLPYIESQKFSIQWVYNILEHKSESERITFEDSDKDLGFILIPDLKWNDVKKGSIYLLAMCHTKNIKSLRDLTVSHLPLLNNIKTKGLEAISKKYSIVPEKLRIYLHYQPSYYHLHVHFTSADTDVPGNQFNRAHLLDTVINNIELSASYYQDVTLTYLLRENDPLLQKMKEAGFVDK